MLPSKIAGRRSFFILIALILVFSLIFFSGTILRKMGRLIMVDEKPPDSDAVIILSTGIEYYPRLIQAAEIYHKGLVRCIVINGNRKTDTLRELEARGFRPGCPWYADTVRILTLLGVPEDRIIRISAEDVYDTVSEAKAVGSHLMANKIRNIVITTSKFHTRRAKYIWKKMYSNQLSVVVVAAKTDPYDPDAWWKDGRQIRWVLAEYGAWIYYWWKTLTGI